MRARVGVIYDQPILKKYLEYLKENIATVVLEGVECRELSLVGFGAVESANVKKAFMFDAEFDDQIEKFNDAKPIGTEYERNLRDSNEKLIAENTTLKAGLTISNAVVEVLKAEVKELEGIVYSRRNTVGQAVSDDYEDYNSEDTVKKKLSKMIFEGNVEKLSLKDVERSLR